jgi:ComF family protein
LLVPAAGVTCPRCGGASDDGAVICLGCHQAPPPQEATVVWGEHEGNLRAAVLALKHGGHDELAAPLGERLAARIAVEPWARGPDVVTPVPSHPLLRLRRGTVAAELLGRAVARALRLPYSAILRRHGRVRQTGLSRAQRRRLPARSFSVRRQVKGRRVLVVDDVTTTGSTLNRAASALLRAGADAVYCAALARTPDARRLP